MNLFPSEEEIRRRCYEFRKPLQDSTAKAPGVDFTQRKLSKAKAGKKRKGATAGETDDELAREGTGAGAEEGEQDRQAQPPRPRLPLHKRPIPLQVVGKLIRSASAASDL